MGQSILTVLMPVYNAEQHLKDAINSVLDQSFQNFKLLIINDGSTDGSMNIIESFNDKRLEVIQLQENGGVVNALNIGIDSIDTKYIARADADDICLPDRFKKQIDFMETHSEVGALGTGFDSLMPDGSIRSGGRFSTEHDIIRLRHLYQIQIIHGTSMLRTDVLKNYGLKFDPDFKHAEDYDFFDRVGNVSRIANIPEPLYLIRHHETRVSEQFSDIQKRNSDRVKVRIFQAMGIDVTETELELIQWLMYQNYSWFDLEKVSALSSLLGRIIQANNNSGYFEPEFLRFQLCSRFLHLCNFMAKTEPEIPQILRGLKEVRFSDGPKLFFNINLKSFLARF
ncbi:MAG: glycosyltransferase [Flavobacteriales bacterium]|nr:glycosyltransferase [Flavobacteriales bacterium]